MQEYKYNVRVSKWSTSNELFLHDAEAGGAHSTLGRGHDVEPNHRAAAVVVEFLRRRFRVSYGVDFPKFSVILYFMKH